MDHLQKASSLFSFYNIKSDAFNVKIWQLCSATIIFSPFSVVDDSNIGLQNVLGLRQREQYR